MKRFISLILALIMVFSLAMPAFAEDKTESHNPDNCENLPVIIVRGMDFGGLYVDLGEETEKPAINTDTGMIVKGVFKILGNLIFKGGLDAAVDGVKDLVNDIFINLSMDKNGDSLYNVSAPKYPESADNYQFLVEGGSGELGMAHACIENFGAGHTYYVNYDWRLDPYVVAKDIKAAVDSAIKNTGHKKVNIVCSSMGGIMTLTYLTEYGYSKINRCLFMSSTFCGAQIASDLLNGKVDIDAKNLYNFLKNLTKDNKALSALIEVFDFFGTFDALTVITDYIIKNYKDEIYQDVVNPIFGRILTLWGLCQPEDYEGAINYILGGRNEADAKFIKRADAIQAVMNGRNKLLDNMVKDGVEIAIVAHYDLPVAPVYENADINGDSVLETRFMAGYATVADYGETLGDDYVAENPKYLSPDRVVDLSTALFPEYTYIIKGATHVACAYGTDYSDFLVWLLSYDGEFYAGASEKYPQFMVSSSDQSLKPF